MSLISLAMTAAKEAGLIDDINKSISEIIKPTVKNINLEINAINIIKIMLIYMMVSLKILIQPFLN
ncbi:MAG: hypothetical protein KAX30_06220 [Candidatus Atribacteria bacterium]|nr:hypothetical protein [Candidatus Atribacteria bacterium]